MINVVLPHVKVLICLYHTLRTFIKEITMDKMSINNAQKTTCLELIQQMTHTEPDVEYNTLHDAFCQAAPPEVKAYFDKNWNPIKEEWVTGFKFSTGNFSNSTNNRLESLNGKLKQVVPKFSSLEHFIEQFFVILPVLRNERCYKAVVSYQNVRVVPHGPDSPKAAYTTFLSSYASSFVLQQIELSETVTYEFQQQDGINAIYSIQTSEGTMEVSVSKCPCCFSLSMKLSCRHIFKLLAKCGVSLYDADLCGKRWTND